MGFGLFGGGRRGSGKPLDQQRISKILGSDMEPVRGGGLAGLVQQYVEGKNRRTIEQEQLHPLEACERADGVPAVAIAGDREIICPINNIGRKEAARLADLFAASPDLLSACRRMAEALQGFTAEELAKRASEINADAFNEAHDAIWSAINKAVGEK